MKLLSNTLYGTALALGLASCATTGATRCDRVTAQYQWAGAIAVGSATLAGSGAVAAALPPTPEARLAYALGSVAVLAVGASAAYLRDAMVEALARECPEPPAFYDLVPELRPVDTSSVGAAP